MNLPPELTSKLKAIILRVRIIQISRGTLATIGVAIASLFVSMAIDAALFIEDNTIRIIISLCGLLLTAVTAYISLWRPLADKIDPIRMARIIETRHPELQERISSALELIQIGGEEGINASKQLLEILIVNAKSDISSLSPKSEFTGKTLKPSLIITTILTIALILALIIRPDDTYHLIKRSVLPAREMNNLKAREYQVIPGDTAKVVGESLTIILRAPKSDSSRAELLIERAGQGQTQERMLKDFASKDEIPTYKLTIPSLRETFTYRIRIGNALTKRYTITVLPRPAIESLTLTITPPSYTELPSTQIVTKVEVPISIPVGTHTHIAAAYNRPMTSKLVFSSEFGARS